MLFFFGSVRPPPLAAACPMYSPEDVYAVDVERDVLAPQLFFQGRQVLRVPGRVHPEHLPQRTAGHSACGRVSGGVEPCEIVEPRIRVFHLVKERNVESE